MALDTDYTSPTYDAYATVATMDSFISAQVIVGGGTDGGWSTMDEPTKEVMVKASTDYADTINWEGTTNVDIVEPYRTQPRDNLYYPNGTVVPADVVQQPVIAMMACWIIATLNDNSSSTTNASGIKKKKVGDVEIEYLVSDQSDAFITAIDQCPAKHLPEEWFTSSVVLGAFGTVGMSRFP